MKKKASAISWRLEMTFGRQKMKKTAKARNVVADGYVPLYLIWPVSAVSGLEEMTRNNSSISKYILQSVETSKRKKKAS